MAHSSDPSSASSPPRITHFHHIAVLDGWRGLSILCVLAAHLLPLGPHRLQLNSSFATLGMVMFFTLSGFLITSTLLDRPDVLDFLIRRFCRIIPLAWLYLLFALPLAAVPLAHYLPMFLFYANLPPFGLDPVDAQFWSLCLEMQFYLFIALIAALFPRRWTLFVPITALLITGLRIFHHQDISILTWYRIDELLAGGILALLFARFSQQPATPQPRATRLRLVLFPIAALLLFLACRPSSGPIQYLRPYLSALMIGLTVFDPRSRLYAVLRTRLLHFLAAISFSLYVLHSTMMVGGFDPPDKLVKYERRILGFLLLFLFAWLSTRFYEAPWIAFGKSLVRRRHARSLPA
jgi:peptidoglycan/LPS O-acetylase OafA/YrhL